MLQMISYEIRQHWTECRLFGNFKTNHFTHLVWHHWLDSALHLLHWKGWGMLNIIWNYGFTALCIELQLNSCKVVNKPRIPGICYNNSMKISVIDIILKLNVFIGNDYNYRNNIIHQKLERNAIIML